MKKYELGEKHLTLNLFRVVALRDIGNNVKAGDIGGWVESKSNLSQFGECWVYDDAQVYGSANVYGNARVTGNAYVYGNAHVYGNANVYGNARVYGNAYVTGNAYVYGNAHVYDQVFGSAHVTGKDYVINLKIVKESIKHPDNNIADTIEHVIMESIETPTRSILLDSLINILAIPEPDNLDWCAAVRYLSQKIKLQLMQ